MTEMSPEQGPKRRVKFDSGPTDTIPFEWAERMLMEWRRREQEHFGRYLQFAALGEMPPAGRKTRGSGVQ